MELDTYKANVETSGSVGEGAIPFFFDEESLHIILGDTLTKMYPNRILAILREYSSNALDSHMEAGQTRPIEITLPSAFNQNFTAEDWGTGMGRYELEEVVCGFGRSTKRKNKKAIGAYGLGFKSALSLVDSFNLVSIKDGRRFTAVVNKNSLGVGQINIIKEEATDLPNGVKVIIPAGQVNDFAELAKTFFLTWDKGSVLVNGAQPKHITESDYNPVGKHGYIAHRKTSYVSNTFSVSMGGVIYKVGNLSYDQKFKLYGNKPWVDQYHFILLAGMGDVSLVPAREEVEINDKTMDFLEVAIPALLKEYIDNLKKEVEDAPTRMKAVELINSYPNLYERKEFTWKGEPIPSSVEVDIPAWQFASKSKNRYHYSNIDVDVRKRTLVDTSAGDIDNSLVLRHMRSWMKHDDIPSTTIMVGTLGTPINPWLQAMIDEGYLKVVTALEVTDKAKAYNKANRQQRQSSGTTSNGPRDTLTYPAYSIIADEDGIDQLVKGASTAHELKESSNAIYYINAEKYGSGISSGFDFGYYGKGEEKLINLLTNYLPKNSTIVVVSTNRKIESFLNRMKDTTALNLIPIVKEKITKGLTAPAELADEIAVKLSNHSGIRRMFKSLVGEKIDSKLFTAVVEKLSDVAENGNITTKASDDAATFLGWSSYQCDEIRSQNNKDIDTNISRSFLEHYPMFDHLSNSFRSNTPSADVVKGIVNYIAFVHSTNGEFVPPVNVES